MAEWQPREGYVGIGLANPVDDIDGPVVPQNIIMAVMLMD